MPRPRTTSRRTRHVQRFVQLGFFDNRIFVLTKWRNNNVLTYEPLEVMAVTHPEELKNMFHRMVGSAYIHGAAVGVSRFTAVLERFGISQAVIDRVEARAREDLGHDEGDGAL